MKILRLVLAVVFLLSLSLAAAACAAEDTPADDPATESSTDPAPEDAGEGDGEASADDPARLLVESKCSLCHTLDRVWSADYDKETWESTVDRMKAQGLVITDEEYATVVEYLSGL